MTLGEGQAWHDGFKKIFVQVLRRLSTPTATRSKSSIALTKPGEGSLLKWNCSCRCCLTYRTSTISRIWLFSVFPPSFRAQPIFLSGKNDGGFDPNPPLIEGFQKGALLKNSEICWDKPPGLWDSVVIEGERKVFFFSSSEEVVVQKAFKGTFSHVFFFFPEDTFSIWFLVRTPTDRAKNLPKYVQFGF